MVEREKEGSFVLLKWIFPKDSWKEWLFFSRPWLDIDLGEGHSRVKSRGVFHQILHIVRVVWKRKRSFKNRRLRHHLDPRKKVILTLKINVLVVFVFKVGNFWNVKIDSYIITLFFFVKKIKKMCWQCFVFYVSDIWNVKMRKKDYFV